jgi:hypothetical protein
MQAETETVADYMELVKGKSQDDFVKAFAHPVFIEKLGVFPHEHGSLMSGTMLEDTLPDYVKDKIDPPDQDIGNAKVFPIRQQEESPGTEIRVGRAPTNDIILPSSSVSRLHAQLIPIKDTGHYQLVDMFASNGTFLNGEKIDHFQKPQVNDRDQVGFGPKYLLIYYSPPAFYELLISLRI